jgi:uncharacterized protein (TIGR02246 family)
MAALMALSLLALCACGHGDAGPGKAGPDPADLKAIERLRDAFLNASNDSDADRLSGLFTADAVFVPDGDAACEGRREIADYFRDVMDQGPSTLKFDVLESVVEGDWAFERIDATLTTQDAGTGEPAEEWDRYFWILRKQPDGSWKIARLIYNVDESDDEEGGSDYQQQT